MSTATTSSNAGKGISPKRTMDSRTGLPTSIVLAWWPGFTKNSVRKIVQIYVV